MKNKRGIAQAFPNPPQGTALRRATVFDVFDISRVLISSIRDLCQADHLNDPKKLEQWAANKDPASVRGWIESGAVLWVATQGDELTAVGGLREGGEISLLYVDSGQSGRGYGSALLRLLENELRAQGCPEARLQATKTAHGFYCRQGWLDDGAPTDWHGIPQFPMRKSLHPIG